MSPVSIECDLWYPGSAPFDRIRICTVDVEEWKAFTRWASAAGLAFPDGLPIMLNSAERDGLQSVVDSIDWDAVPTDALGCVAMLSEFLRQAKLQNAGVAIGAR